MKQRGLGGRNRIEQEAQRRRARARHHLSRAREKRGGAGIGGRANLILGGAGGVLLAAIVGVWTGDDALAQLGEPWRVTAVEVEGAERLRATEVARAAGVELGGDYHSAEPRALVQALREHAWVAEARAARLPGGTVVLGIRERQPLAVIEARGGPLGVDAEGRPFAVLEEREAENLPRLRLSDAPLPGEADERLAEAIRVARTFPDRGLALPRLVELSPSGNPEGLVMRLPGLDARIVLGSEELDSRVMALAELLRKRPAEVAGAAQVDLRFADQAVLSEKDSARKG